MNWTLHERAWRGDAYLRTQGPVVVCGAGAVGGNVAESLARCGVGPLVVIDCDRVSEHNVGTQPYALSDVGAPKAEVLACALDAAVHADVRGLVVRLDENNGIRLLRGSLLVVDAFDNSAGRLAVQRACRSLGAACVHAGLSADGYGEVAWEPSYEVPADNDGVPPCDVPLARPLVTMLAAIACESVLRWLEDGTAQGWALTLRDLRVTPTEACAA